VRVVLDTNVFISGVFFAGPPAEILAAWGERRLEVVLSPEILEEYHRVGERLSKRFPGVHIDPLLDFAVAHARVCLAPRVPQPVCDDPADDKFLACALASRTRVIVSGDRHLLQVSGYSGIRILRPRRFVDACLHRR
jgi:putative PIN family toxin of toxin-antitoxin system